MTTPNPYRELCGRCGYMRFQHGREGDCPGLPYPAAIFDPSATREAPVQCDCVGPCAAQQAIGGRRCRAIVEAAAILAALAPFRHMRVLDDDRSLEALDIRNLDEDGREITIAYARNQEWVDKLNSAFEQVRHVLSKHSPEKRR